MYRYMILLNCGVVNAENGNVRLWLLMAEREFGVLRIGLLYLWWNTMILDNNVLYAICTKITDGEQMATRGWCAGAKPKPQIWKLNHWIWMSAAFKWVTTYETIEKYEMTASTILACSWIGVSFNVVPDIYAVRMPLPFYSCDCQLRKSLVWFAG